MKIGIMQPYFLPYIGYFSLIKHTERFVLADSVQFIRHGWIARNRILKPGSGWQYISVPLIKYSQDTKIRDIRIKNALDWRNNILRQLEHYKKRAPFYRDTIEVLKTAFNIETESIVRLNAHVLKTVCGYIGVGLNVDIFSEMHLSIGDVKAPDEWSLNICKALGNVDEYWNPEGGLEFYDRSKYETAGIDINFIKVNLPSYPQRRPEFEAGLSIVDVMMFNEPEKINAMLDDYKLV
jgi:hypothetical protein